MSDEVDAGPAGRAARAARAAAPVPPALVWGFGFLALGTAYFVTHAMVDLDVYRMGASALLHGRDPYGMRLADHGLLYTYTPFSTIAFAPVALLPLWAARVLTAAGSMLSLFFVVHQVIRRLLPRRRADQLWTIAVVVAAVAALSEPVRRTLNFGQVNLVLMLLVVVDLLLLRRSRAAGTLIGLAAGIKLTPVVYIAYLFLTGRRRTAVRASVVAAATVLVGWVVLPTATREYFTRYLFDTTRIGNLSLPVNQSLNGAIARLVHSNTAGHHLWMAIAGGTLVIGLWAAERSYRAWGELAGLSIAAVTGLLVSPISWNHHWVWWILPSLLLAAGAAERRSPRLWLAWGAWTSTFFLVPAVLIPRQYGHQLHQSVPEMIRGSAYVVAGLALVISVAAVHALRRGGRDGVDVSRNGKLPANFYGRSARGDATESTIGAWARRAPTDGPP